MTRPTSPAWWIARTPVGLLERRVDEAGRRAKHLTLTPAGRRLRSELEARLFAGRPRLARLSRDDQQRLRELLRRAAGSAGDEPSS